MDICISWIIKNPADVGFDSVKEGRGKIDSICGRYNGINDYIGLGFNKKEIFCCLNLTVNIAFYTWV